MEILTKTKIIEGTFVREEEKDVPYEVKDQRKQDSQLMSAISLVRQTYCIFETKEEKIGFIKCAIPGSVIPENGFKEGDKVKIEQKYFLFFKTSERIVL